MRLIKSLSLSEQECRVKSQFLSLCCRILKPSQIAIKFPKILSKLEVTYLLDLLKILDYLDGHISL